MSNSDRITRNNTSHFTFPYLTTPRFDRSIPKKMASIPEKYHKYPIEFNSINFQNYYIQSSNNLQAWIRLKEIDNLYFFPSRIVNCSFSPPNLGHAKLKAIVALSPAHFTLMKVLTCLLRCSLAPWPLGCQLDPG